MNKTGSEKTKPLHFLLVDFENIQKINLAHVHSAYRIIVFTGANQTRIPVETVQQAQPPAIALNGRPAAGKTKQRG